MKIVTINVPITYIEAMERLVGEEGLYPSRSELVRCATRNFLLKELKLLKSLKSTVKEPEVKINDFDDDNFVRIPVAKKTTEVPQQEYKTYKILRKLY